MHYTLVKMQMSVVEEKENPFLNRKELVVELKHPGKSTPSKAELIKELASAHSVDESQVKIDYIFTKKGMPESLAKVKILKEKPKKEEKKEVIKPEEKKAEAKPKEEEKEKSEEKKAVEEKKKKEVKPEEEKKPEAKPKEEKGEKSETQTSKTA